jgi:hypothetical protein
MVEVRKATPVAAFSEVLADGEFIAAMDATLEGEPIVLGCLGPMDGPPRFRYQIHLRAGAAWTQIELEDLGAVAPQFVGRLGRDRWIVLGGHGGKVAETAAVFDDEGHIVRRFDPGRDVQCCATTEDGQVWIGYGEDPHGPLDDHGVVALDERGELRFGFNLVADQHGLPWVFDCYALNATGPDDVWLCYYTDFPLVRIYGHELVEKYTDQPVAGARVIAVGRGRVLFAGAWGPPEGSWDEADPFAEMVRYKKPTHVFRLMQLDGFASTDLQFLDPSGAAFDPRAHPAEGLSMFARGSRLFLRRPDGLFMVDVNDL